jgi:hypothetical protein
MLFTLPYDEVLAGHFNQVKTNYSQISSVPSYQDQILKWTRQGIQLITIHAAVKLACYSIKLKLLFFLGECNGKYLTK